jgi:hypothetical protein
MSEPPLALPPVHVAVLDRDGLLALISDVEAVGTLLGLTIKRGARAHGDDRAPPLHEAVQALLDGSASGLQLRYLHEGRQWWDTIMRMGDGFRVVRIDHSQTLT